MVAVKTDQSNHDFSKDPIETIIDGNFVRANKTSLGADNGIGVAMILAIFADKTLKHGPLEALITTNEEIGMLGVIDFDSSLIESKYFINLD
jgi:dipeptidase D